MKKKRIKKSKCVYGWCCISDDGDLVHSTVSETKNYARMAAESWALNEWKTLYQRGWRVTKAKVVVVK